MPRVMARCRISDAVTATHAVMTARSFKRLKVPIHFWCASCRMPHRRTSNELWLEGDIRLIEKPDQSDRD